MTPSKEDWLVATLRAEPSRFPTTQERVNTALFVLYCISVGLCHSFDDFAQGFVVELAYRRHLSRLLEEGFIAEQDGHYTLTALGERALVGFVPTNEENAE